MPHASQPQITRRPARIARFALLALALVAPLAALQQKPYKIGDPDVSPPRLIAKVDPQYIRQARDARIQGTVVLDTVIGRSGRVEQTSITQGLDPGLDANAITAVKQWKFEPGTKDGKSVAVRATIEVTFRLQ